MIGADVVDIRRIADAIKNAHFICRVFTQGERTYAESKHDPAQTYAGMFAAKEAVAKLSGKGLRGFWLSDIEISHDGLGKPEVILHGNAGALFSCPIYVSISHERDYAFAVASCNHEDIHPIMPGKEISDGDFELPRRDRFTHKGDYGRVYVVGGSGNLIGAPLICAEAALRSGAGLTTLCVPSSLMDSYRARVKEIMLMPIADEAGLLTFDRAAFEEIASRADAVVIGPGAGKCQGMSDIIRFMFDNLNGTLVLDADAINALSLNPRLLYPERKCKLILTPHVGEYERLRCALDVQSVGDCALKANAVIACKSAHTLISDGVSEYKVTAGCAAMAKGGSGDTLAGIIGAYSCRTIPLIAATLACHYFGRCGEKAASIKGENAVIATDIIALL